jgi:SAM-dependent methyltransferase
MVSSISDSARAFVKLVYRASIREENIAFYNGIADLYNETMEKDPSNLIIRRIVQKKVDLLVPSGRVMDFGGGTGLDLEWLAKGRSVIFCEPSERMREKAHARRLKIPHGDRVVFLDDTQSDYTRWEEASPFMGTLDAALCNFGVINYIPDLEELFSRLAGVLKPGGHLFALALKYGFVKRFRRHRRHALASLLTRQPFVLHIPGEKGGQTVIIHTIAQIDRASGPWFHMDDCDLLGINDFMLIHMVRK